MVAPDNPQEQTPDRRMAVVKLRRAQEEISRKRWARAEELLRESIQTDGSFVEAHIWLAKVYEQMNDPHKAARAYQGALAVDSDNVEAWAGLERHDPAAAERLRRLNEIAPDPFVFKRQARGGNLADLEALGEGDEECEELAPPEAEPAALTGPPRGPAPWEYEQDRPMLQRWLSEPPVAALVEAIEAQWANRSALQPVYDDGVHLSETMHTDLWGALRTACARLGLEVPRPYSVAERGLDAFVIQDRPLSLAVLTGFMRSFTPQEQAFHLGRVLHPARVGYLAAWQAAEVIVGRKPAMAAGCEDMLRDATGGRERAWQRGLSQEQIGRLRKIGHAWQQRVALSADRAGLRACADLETACQAIARATARGPEDAKRMTVAQLLERFRGQDPATLSAIPPEESPTRSPAYATYRIQMLRWWASTPESVAVLA